MMSDTESRSDSETVETIEQYDAIREELDGREVTLVYDSVHSDGDVEFSGTLSVRENTDWTVKGWDNGRNVWYGRVDSAAGNQPRVGGFVRLKVHADEDSEDADDDPEPVTDGGQREAVRAKIDEQYGPGQRLAEPTAELTRIVREVSEGDSLNVEYVHTNLETNAAGGVSVVEGRDTGDRDSVDIRFGDGCYLHVNADTGDYYFQDRGRERPEDGYQVTAVTLRGGE